MNDWGWNPSTIQVVISSVVGLGTLVLLAIVYLGTQAGQRSAKAAQDSADVLAKDADARTRPWLGLSVAEFTTSNAKGDDRIEIQYQNVGVLPAQDVVLSIKILPNMDDPSDPESYDFEDNAIGTIFPREPGTYTFAIPKKWRVSEEDVVIGGLLKYKYGDREYTTKLKLDLHDDRPRIGWSNFEAT